MTMGVFGQAAESRPLRFLVLLLLALSVWRYITHVVQRESEASFPESLWTPTTLTFDVWGGCVLALLTPLLVSECVRPRHTTPYMGVLFVLLCAQFAVAILTQELRVVGHLTSALVSMCVLWACLLISFTVVEHHIEPMVLSSVVFSDTDHVYTTSNRWDYLSIRLPLALWWVYSSAEVLAVCHAVALNAQTKPDMRIFVTSMGGWVLVSVGLLLTTGDTAILIGSLWMLWGVANANSSHSSNESHTMATLAGLGAFVLGGLFCFLVLHKAWRGPKDRWAPLFSLRGVSAPRRMAV
ncbi:hypothetical protein H310_09935 [Aphanomyces invadans]|uniref:Uncharacterized protein n=1 Tax=Aphanomyces invadans TaxID=157072 RepID=A0A024TSJ7_9STRA|nr:hypothetical protein H310_09935 [Aphanomyces invadans]ETV97130.1 hypothetical protein H310_09935 [Aphanomyces invadans]RHY27729.1 hypothetical protein DYB32_006573 [Aphanomyces invadans]|eukprot:XP_008874376.1 hypothetical protein H310_09935 [Aphanomyces invadans]